MKKPFAWKGWRDRSVCSQPCVILPPRPVEGGWRTPDSSLIGLSSPSTRRAFSCPHATRWRGPMAKFLITSALPYVNGVKHLGNLAGSLLPADIHARFRRQTGHEVLFLCGTDEHGTPAELAAQAAGLPVAAYCSRQHAIQADIYRRFGLSFDHFSRTSGVANRLLTQELFRR